MRRAGVRHRLAGHWRARPLVDCFASSHDELMDIVTGSFPGLPGVTHREVVFVTRLYRQASEWRSGTLEPARARLVSAEPLPEQPAYSPDRLDAALLEELAKDGRASWAELGAACGVSPQTARRRVERFLATGYMALRCDTSTAAQQGLREVTLVLNVPAQCVDDVGHYFAAFKQLPPQRPGPRRSEPARYPVGPRLPGSPGLRARTGGSGSGKCRHLPASCGPDLQASGPRTG